MAEYHRRRNQKGMWENPAAKVGIVVFAIFMLFSLVIYTNDVLFKFDFIPSSEQIKSWLTGGNTVTTVADGEIAVHYIDVGQGDCELIIAGDMNVLIDCGEKIYSDRVIRYLRDLGIRRLNLVIATHPHEDHIGGMADIMQEFTVDKIVMPEIPSEILPMSTNFERMLDVIDRKGITAEYSRQGSRIQLGSGAELDFIAPVHDDYSTLNNFSIVCRLVHGERSFLFTGDVERSAESDIVNSGQYIKCDVLKVGHHGSTSSSTPAFIEAADPEYAVIEVGAGNSYGHPKQEVLNRLVEHGCRIYTTMDSGNIVFVSDGESLRITTEKGSVYDTEEAA